MRDNPKLKDKPMAVGGNSMLVSTWLVHVFFKLFDEVEIMTLCYFSRLQTTLLVALEFELQCRVSSRANSVHNLSLFRSTSTSTRASVTTSGRCSPITTPTSALWVSTRLTLTSLTTWNFDYRSGKRSEVLLKWTRTLSSALADDTSPVRVHCVIVQVLVIGWTPEFNLARR